MAGLTLEAPPGDDPVEAVILLGRGMPAGEQQQAFQDLGRRLMAGGLARRVESAFVEMTDPALDVVIRRLSEDGVRACVIVPLILPFDRNLAGWLGRALSGWLGNRAEPMRVALTAAPDDLDGLGAFVGQALRGEAAVRDLRETLKPLSIKPGASMIPRHARTAYVCLGPRCALAGGWHTYDRLRRALGPRANATAGDDRMLVVRTACQGPCNAAPLVTVQPEGIWYGPVPAGEEQAIAEARLTPFALRPGERLRRGDGALVEPDLPLAQAAAGPVKVQAALLRPAMRHAAAIAAFLEIENTSVAPVTLVALRAAESPRVAVHDPRTGHAALRHGDGLPITIGGGERLSFRPGEAHAMFLDLPGPLPDPGEAMPLTLIFADGQRLLVPTCLHPPLH